MNLRAIRWAETLTFDRMLFGALALSLGLLGFVLWQTGWPGDETGYRPPQPIRFSHRQHVTELEIGCAYCHAGASNRAAAEMPSVESCMSCHRFVLAASQAVKDEQWAAAREGRPVRRVVSEEIGKLLRASGVDDQLRPVPGLRPEAIAWVKVVRVPDFVFFTHGAHARVGVECVECHGSVETFDETRVDRSLSMGFCVNCHRRTSEHGIDGREVNASVDCIACHR